MEIKLFDRTDPIHHSQAAALWNAACGERYSISPNFIRYNTLPTTGCLQTGWFAVVGENPVGFCLASAVMADPEARLGWIDALAVSPAFQRQGAGSALLRHARGWLTDQERQHIRLGGSLRPFTPGLPSDLNSLDFFLKHGFEGSADQPYEWDVAFDLENYQSNLPQGIQAEAHPVQISEIPALLAFAESAFPGRWEFELKEFFKDGGRCTDIILAWVGSQPVGFCSLTLEDSIRPLDRYYPQRLPRPWGQLGMVGVDAAARGKGYGLLVIDAGLKELQAQGVRGCVIDWTTLTGLYGKFGFQQYTQYTTLFQNL